MRKLYVIIVLIVIVLAGGGFLFFTAPGGEFIVDSAISLYGLDANIAISKAQGHLAGGLFFNELKLTGFDKLPEGSVLRLEGVNLRLSAPRPEALAVSILKGRLELPSLQKPVLFSGSYQEGVFDINVYANHLSVSRILERFSSPVLSALSGEIESIDLYIKGDPKEFYLTGDFTIKTLQYQKRASLNDAQGTLNLKISDPRKKLKLNGLITFGQSVISGPKIATIEIDKGEVKFNDDPKNPSLDITAKSQVEDVKINIALRGTRVKPDLELTSIPSIPKEWLLVMLGTGKSWGSIEESISSQKLSPAIARDFLDYMFFGGAGKKTANFLGIKEWSVLYEEEAQGFKVKKTISDRINAIYGIEQTQTQTTQTPQTESVQTIGGEYQVTDSISLDAERKIRTTSGRDINESTQPREDSQIMLKYKKTF